MTLLTTATGLVLPVALGALTGIGRLWDDPDAAVGHLNLFALYVAFPALILVGLAADPAPLPSSPTLWLTPALAAAVALVPLRTVARRTGAHAGTLALVTVFGNVAYLGLPVVEAVLGPESMSVASLLVGEHVLISLGLGPLLLLAWSGRAEATDWGASARKVLRQPLFWSPLLGLASRALPAGAREGVVALLGPVGKAAGPTALFLLGLYLHTHLGRLRRMDGGAWLHVAVKLAWVPACTIGVILLLGTVWPVSERDRAVMLLLASMPPAITTFAIARAWDEGAGSVAQAIVAGTLVSAVSLPLVSWWVAPT